MVEGIRAYNLELDRHNTKVEYLHCGPHKVIGFEGWHINVLELAGDCTLSAAFGNCHECKETCQTCWKISKAEARRW